MQPSLGGILLLGLFAISILATYLSIRLNWLPLGAVSVIGSIVNTVLLVAYSLSQGNDFGKALTVGLVIGLLFTVITVSIAVYFHAGTLTTSGKAGESKDPAKQ